jgi:hypothetical protein
VHRQRGRRRHAVRRQTVKQHQRDEDRSLAEERGVADRQEAPVEDAKVVEPCPERRARGVGADELVLARCFAEVDDGGVAEDPVGRRRAADPGVRGDGDSGVGDKGGTVRVCNAPLMPKRGSGSICRQSTGALLRIFDSESGTDLGVYTISVTK